MDVGKTAREDADHIADGRALWRSDDSDAAGEQRQRFFARGVEEAFGFEAFFQLLEGKLQRALPHQVDFLDVNLIFAALLVDADAAAHGDLQTVLGAELDAALLLLEVNAANLGAIIFQSEINVAGLRFAAVGDFALDGDVGKIFGQQVADLSGQLADGPGLAIGHEIERELSGHLACPVGESGYTPPPICMNIKAKEL